MNTFKKFLAVVIVCGINAPAFAGCGVSRQVHPVSVDQVDNNVAEVSAVVQQETLLAYTLRKVNQLEQVYKQDCAELLRLCDKGGNSQLIKTSYDKRQEEHAVDLRLMVYAKQLADQEGNEELAKRAGEVSQKVGEMNLLIESAYTKFKNAQAAEKEEGKRLVAAVAKCKTKAKPKTKR